MGRREFLGTMAAGVAVASLAACSGGGSGGGDQVHIWVLQDPVQNPIQQHAIDAFKPKSGGTKLRLDTFPNDNYTQRLRVAMGTPKAPDVLFNWGGASISPYVDAGQLVDLSDKLDADPTFKSAFLPSVLDAGKIGDRFYGIPLRGMQPVILFYNKQIFAKQNAQPPQTWDELLDLVDQFSKAHITPFALDGATSWTELMWLEYLTDRIGGPAAFQRLVAGESGAWSDPAITGAINHIRELVGRGGFGTNYASVTYGAAGGAETLFARGRAAMYLMGSWEYVNQLNQNPSFAKEALGWTTFPTISGGKGDPSAVVGNPTNYFSVNKRSAHVDDAVEWLRTQMSSERYVDELIAGGDVPAVANIESRLAKSPDAGYTTFVYKMATAASSFTLSWDQALPSAVKEVMLTQLQQVFLRKNDADGFAQSMEAAK